MNMIAVNISLYLVSTHESIRLRLRQVTVDIYFGSSIRTYMSHSKLEHFTTGGNTVISQLTISGDEQQQCGYPDWACSGWPF